MPAPKRELLLDTAEAIFAKEGFKGVSVDRLLREAGVAKMTLYKGFESKNDLIAETLRRRGDRLAAHLEAYALNADESPERQILSVFDAMEDWSKQADFNGCYFINALTEYNASNEDISVLARDYKGRFLNFLKSKCQQLERADHDEMSRVLLLLIEGATASHMSLGDDDSYARAKSVAAEILSLHSGH